MKKIGLTGGIATGKSTVSMILRELEVPVIDADAVDRCLSEKGSKVWQAVYDHFGSKFFLPDGEMDRNALGRLIFSDKEARETLNRITHPIIQREMEEILRQTEKNQDPPIAVLDVPLLFEANMQHLCDEIWVVTAPEDMRFKRIMRSGWLPYRKNCRSGG